jgi:hypothetical protein
MEQVYAYGLEDIFTSRERRKILFASPSVGMQMLPP